LSYKPNPPFLISDIRALWRSALSARMPECHKFKKNGGLGLYGAEYLECNLMMTLGFKGLMVYVHSPACTHTLISCHWW